MEGKGHWRNALINDTLADGANVQQRCVQDGETTGSAQEESDTKQDMPALRSGSGIKMKI
jgi:hypothetical protein